MSTCYFHYLAPELVQDIFLLSVVKRSGHFVEFKHDSAPLSLLHVCKRWRAITFATSGLFDSITLRRRTHDPIGFDFFRDSYIILDFLKFPRNAAPWLGPKELASIGFKEPFSNGQELLLPRPLSIELRYGDIRHFGNTLMWADLVSMTRAILDTTSNLERFHLRFPDDCMEKVLRKICTGSGKKIVCPSLKSLSLHSTRESILVKRYQEWWNDDDYDDEPSSMHWIDTTGIPALTELGVHFPGPLGLKPNCECVGTLNISIFKWSQFEEYISACPNVEHLIIELRASLKGKAWEAKYGPDDLPMVHTLEIRSHLFGHDCAGKVIDILDNLRFPKLKRLILRRHHRATMTEPAAFCFSDSNDFKCNFQNLEEIEFIDFHPEPFSVSNEIGVMLSNAPKLRRLVYREVNMHSETNYMMLLLSQLCSEYNPMCAPCLEVLEIDTGHYRAKEPHQGLIDGLVYVIGSRSQEQPLAPGNTEKIDRHLLREVYLPSSLLKLMLRRETFTMRMAFEGILLEPALGIEPLENEDDLDDEGEPRDPGYEFERPNWDDNTLNAVGGESADVDICSESIHLESEEDLEGLMGEYDSATNSNNVLGADDMDTYHKYTDLDMDYSLNYEKDEDVDSMGGDTLVDSSRPSSYHSAVSGLSRYDSVAEVEAML